MRLVRPFHPSHCPFINSRCWLVLTDERVDSHLALGRWTDLLSESDRYITPAVMHITRVYPGSCQFSSSALHLHFYHSLSCVGTRLSLPLSVYLLISVFRHLKHSLCLRSYLWFVSPESLSLPIFSSSPDLCLHLHNGFLR